MESHVRMIPPTTATTRATTAPPTIIRLVGSSVSRPGMAEGPARLAWAPRMARTARVAREACTDRHGRRRAGVVGHGWAPSPRDRALGSGGRAASCVGHGTARRPLREDGSDGDLGDRAGRGCRVALRRREARGDARRADPCSGTCWTPSREAGLERDDRRGRAGRRGPRCRGRLGRRSTRRQPGVRREVCRARSGSASRRFPSRPTAALIVLGDQPMVSPAVIRALLASPPTDRTTDRRPGVSPRNAAGTRCCWVVRRSAW